MIFVQHKNPTETLSKNAVRQHAVLYRWAGPQSVHLFNNPVVTAEWV